MNTKFICNSVFEEHEMKTQTFSHQKSRKMRFSRFRLLEVACIKSKYENFCLLKFKLFESYSRKCKCEIYKDMEFTLCGLI